MKTIIKIFLYSVIGTALLGVSGCNDFLDVEPVSQIVPENYLTDESQLEAYTVNRYNALAAFTIGADNQTDNQATNQAWSAYTKSFYLLPLDGGNWNFEEIYQINHFFDEVLPRWRDGSITGSESRINHYIGEMYFFRAYQYFNKMQLIGDFPIVRNKLPNNKEVLTKASIRMPHNEVARFIISDLDSAALLMNFTPLDGNKNRLCAQVALLFKSRVALYEGTWLKYFKDTPFVPGNIGWPGKGTHPDFQWEAGSIDAEINWFLDEAIEASALVADVVSLTPNTKILPQSVSDPANPYLEMYGAEDMSEYSEILLWKDFDFGLGIVHDVTGYAATGNYSIGLTRSLVDSYLMQDGLPIYASSANKPYKGDGITSLLVENRDPRMFLFVKQPLQINGYIGTRGGNTKGWVIEGDKNDGFIYPDIFSGSPEDKYSTGYACRKGWNPNISFWENQKSGVGKIVFRASEAYLNYIEAYYERHGSLDGKADTYWKAIRSRAGVDPNYNKTISSTIISKEALDWGSYSGEEQLSDNTLYNIRRERRLELMAEGFRMMDLRRWRSFDHLISRPFKIEGMKIYSSEIASVGWFGYNSSWLDEGWAQESLSPRSESDYLMPMHLQGSNNPIIGQGGVTWKMGHYWEPIPIAIFKETSNQAEGFSDSPVYQNPYWGMKSDEPAQQ